jgi:hypothetical protein
MRNVDVLSPTISTATGLPPDAVPRAGVAWQAAAYVGTDAVQELLAKLKEVM